MWEQIKDIALSFFIALIMAAVVYAMSFLNIQPLLLLLLQLITGAILTLALSILFKSEEFHELKTIALFY